MTITIDGLRKNMRAFRKLEPGLLEDHEGEVALLLDGVLVELFPDKESARAAAAERFPEADFAISPPIGMPPLPHGTFGFGFQPVTL